MNYYKIYKPFNVLSQFSQEVPGQLTLAGLFDFPKDVYPVGRLDRDSEGLLLLTNDKSVNKRLLDPKMAHERTYLVQVDGAPQNKDLQPLKNGMTIKVNKKQIYTLPAKVNLIDHPTVPDRNPPIRVRKSIPANWLELTLKEGKNRQVRRMCAGIGFPTLRLIRQSIEGINISHMEVGDVIEMSRSEFYRKLGWS